MHVLDNRRNVVLRKFRVLLGKPTLYCIDLRPLFLRHARHRRQRTGFSLGKTGFSLEINVVFGIPQSLTAGSLF
jgi:hypothetical protein